MKNDYFVLYSLCSHWKYRQPVDNSTTLVVSKTVMIPFIHFCSLQGFPQP